jgi:hypothetical protein
VSKGGSVVGEPEHLGEPDIDPAGLQRFLAQLSLAAHDLGREGPVGGLDGQLSQQPAGELALGGGEGRPEQLQRPAQVGASVAGPAQPKVGLAELPLPASSPQPVLPGAAGLGGLVEGERIGKEQRGLPVGGAREGLLSRKRQVPDRLGRDPAAGPVVGKQRIEPGQLGLMPLLLIPLGDRAVQRSALRAQHQLVGYVPGDDVLEHPRQFRFGRLEQDEVAALEAVELIGQGRPVSRDGVDIGQQPVGEAAPDDAGHLQRQLLPGGQPVDAGEDHALHRVRK